MALAYCMRGCHRMDVFMYDCICDCLVVCVCDLVWYGMHCMGWYRMVWYGISRYGTWMCILPSRPACMYAYDCKCVCLGEWVGGRTPVYARVCMPDECPTPHNECVNACVCVYGYAYVCMGVWVCARPCMRYVYVCVYVCVRPDYLPMIVCMPLCMYTRMHVGTPIYHHVCVAVRVYVCQDVRPRYGICMVPV